MYNFIIKKTITDYENVTSHTVRTAYGKLSGISGIISNTVLVALKLAVGLISGSIAIIADAMNNLMDAASALITLFAFKYADAPRDEKHPFGHRRTEQIAGVIISVLIIVVGIQLFLKSAGSLIHPKKPEFNHIAVIILAAAILIKLWQCLFNYRIGKRIGSGTVLAAAADARNDIVITSAVLISVIVYYFSEINIDAVLGMGIAAFIIKSGISFMLQISSPLIGEAPDENLVTEITRCIMSHKGALGMHDLELHSYGAGEVYGSVHIEVDAHSEFLAVHDLIDHIERDLHESCGINITVHPDPQ